MKRRMATLAIVGAMAVAAMAPATVFAADKNNQTTVGYTAGGTPITELDAVVLVPKNTMFDSIGQNKQGFNVTAKIYDAETSQYVDVSGTNKLEKNIDVSVLSAGKGLLKTTGSSATLTYSYYKGTDSTEEIDLTQASAQSVGTFVAADGNGTIVGNLTLDADQTVAEADYGKVFTDQLTYTFAVGDKTYPSN